MSAFIGLPLGETGLTITARIVTGATEATQALTESPSGFYQGTWTGTAANKTYLVGLFDANGILKGSGSFSTDSSGNEITYSAPLTAQQTRDSSKLAPTAGAAAEGSIDDLLSGVGEGSGGTATIENQEKMLKVLQAQNRG